MRQAMLRVHHTASPICCFRVATSIVGVVLGANISSCSFVLETDRVQCTVTSDCQERGSDFARSTCQSGFCVVAGETAPRDDPDASSASAREEGPLTCARNSDCSEMDICVDEACVDPFACEQETSDEAVTVTVPVSDVFGRPLADTPARLCQRIDPQCLSPVEEPVTDEDGLLTVDLPPGFLGYLEFTVDSFFPQLQFLPPAPVDGASLPGVSLAPTQFILGLGAAVGAAPDPERGHLFLTLLSCYGGAEHIELSSNGADEDVIEYYVLDGVPSSDLTQTTKDGSGGFLNFPTGNTAVALTHAKTNVELAKLSYVIRAGFLTAATVQPDFE